MREKEAFHGIGAVQEGQDQDTPAVVALEDPNAKNEKTKDDQTTVTSVIDS